MIPSLADCKKTGDTLLIKTAYDATLNGPVGVRNYLLHAIRPELLGFLEQRWSRRGLRSDRSMQIVLSDSWRFLDHPIPTINPVKYFRSTW